MANLVNLPTYEQIAAIYKQKIALADEINYDINTQILTFMACEGGLFQCLYKSNVVGTNEQMENHYIESLRNSFPHKRFGFNLTLNETIPLRIINGVSN